MPRLAPLHGSWLRDADGAVGQHVRTHGAILLVVAATDTGTYVRSEEAPDISLAAERLRLS